MAKKNTAAKSKASKKAAKKSTKVKVGPFASARHVLHRVHVAAPFGGKACVLIITRPGTSDNPSAFNLAPGFGYTVTHKKRDDKKCELTIKQGKFEGIPTSKSKSLVVLNDPPPPVSLCLGVDGCDINCPDPDNFPIANCATEQCDPLPPTIAPGAKKRAAPKK
jgi:hypothetical protein